MLTNVPVPVELLSSLIEIHSNLGYLLDYGMDEDIFADIEELYAHIGELLNQIERSISA